MRRQFQRPDGCANQMNYKEIPKVELHCHLEACFRPETVMEVCRSLGLDVPQDPKRFHDEWLLSKPLENLEVALQRFVDIQKIWCSEEVIERMAFEASEYAVGQGIRIMEFRYAPDFIANGKPHLTFQKIHDAILRGLARAADFDIAIGLIGIVQKTLSLDDAERTIDFIVENADTFVAIDFADKDTHELSSYASMVAKAQDAGLHVTVHAGEEPVPTAPAEVRAAIEVLGAERIGHGIHIINDDAVMALTKERGVALEVCPTSNWLTSSVRSTREHPIRRLIDEGVAVTVNSDDPGLFGIDLCHEYELLHREHGFSLEDFGRCNDIAAAKSFIPFATRQAAWPREIMPGQ
jgi:adenosine deaminase